MATHHDDVSVRFVEPSDPAASRAQPTFGGGAVPVPGLVDRPLPEVIRTLRQAALDIQVRPWVVDEHTDQLVCAALSPTPGTIVRPGVTVRVLVTGPAMVTVPDVRMCSEAGAIEAIIDAGLLPGARTPRPRPRSGCDEVVVRTHPRSGTWVAPGAQVDYEVLPGHPRRGAMAGG